MLGEHFYNIDDHIDCLNMWNFSKAYILYCVYNLHKYVSFFGRQ